MQIVNKLLYFLMNGDRFKIADQQHPTFLK